MKHMQFILLVDMIIVIVNSRFLQRPQKRSRRNQLIYRRLSKTKSIGSGSDPESQAGRQIPLIDTIRRVGQPTSGITVLAHKKLL